MKSHNNWMDPLYLKDLFTEEENSIQETTKKFCESYILPKVV